MNSKGSSVLGALALGLTSLARSASPALLPPPADQQLARDILKELVELNTTHEHGSTAAAKAIQQRLLAVGFSPNDVLMLAPPDRPSKGNLVVRYHGKGLGKPILDLGHLDVVEARPEDWSVDPFKLTEKDGWFYGRGSQDMKDGFERLAALEPGPQSADMLAVAKSPPDLAAAERLSKIVRFNAQLRTTCVATLISGGHAENALPQRAKATIQCRMMPGDTAEHVQAALNTTLNDPRISVTLDAPPIVSPESPPTPQVLAKADAVVHSMWPGVPIIPTMATGFSDGRQTRNAGLPTYDLSGLWSDVDDNRAHGRDERISVQAFDQSVEYTYRLVKAFGRTK